MKKFGLLSLATGMVAACTPVFAAASYSQPVVTTTVMSSNNMMATNNEEVKAVPTFTLGETRTKDFYENSHNKVKTLGWYEADEGITGGKSHWLKPVFNQVKGENRYELKFENSKRSNDLRFISQNLKMQVKVPAHTTVAFKINFNLDVEYHINNDNKSSYCATTEIFDLDDISDRHPEYFTNLCACRGASEKFDDASFFQNFYRFECVGSQHDTKVVWDRTEKNVGSKSRIILFNNIYDEDMTMSHYFCVSHLITGEQHRFGWSCANPTITIQATQMNLNEALFQTDSWENVIKYANQGIEALRSHYGIQWFDGLERKIKINGTEHTVRVIGQDHDELALEPTKKAALTFELVDLLSHKDGTPCSGVFDKNNRHNYINSSLRANLNGKSEGTPTWKMSAMDMIAMSPENKVIVDNIKLVTKHAAIWSKSSPTHFNNEPFRTKLFPLTPYELGHQEEWLSKKYVPIVGNTYLYYAMHKDHKYTIKKPVIENNGGSNSRPYNWNDHYRYIPYDNEAKYWTLGTDVHGYYVKNSYDGILKRCDKMNNAFGISFAFCI